jgi:hypothetical protein
VAETGPRLANVAGKGRLTVVLQIFFPEFKNNFEAAFSRAGQGLRHFCLAIAAGKIANFDPRKVALKIYKTKPALPSNFSLGPKGI